MLNIKDIPTKVQQSANDTILVLKDDKTELFTETRNSLLNYIQNNHTHTKESIGLGNVLNSEQVTKSQLETSLSSSITKVPTSNAVKVYVDGKNYDTIYSQLGHTHSSYSLSTHNHDLMYSNINHNHNTLYAQLSHTHSKDDVGLSNVLNAEQITIASKENVLSGDEEKIPSSYAVKNYVDSLTGVSLELVLTNSTDKIPSSHAVYDFVAATVLGNHTHTPTQVGLSNVTNDKQLRDVDKETTLSGTTNKIPDSSAVKNYVDSKISTITPEQTISTSTVNIPSSNAVKNYVDNKTWTPTQVGLSNVLNSTQVTTSQIEQTPTANVSKILSSAGLLNYLKALNISVNTANFNNNLTSSENTIQKALEKLDDLIITLPSDGILDGGEF